MTQAESDGSGPLLWMDDIRRSTGYGVRCIASSRSQPELVFIGCKDGSLTAIALEGDDPPGSTLGAEEQEAKKLPTRPTAVRAIAVLDEASVLLGREDGAIDLVSVSSWREFVGRESAEGRTQRTGGSQAASRSPGVARLVNVGALGKVHQIKIVTSARGAGRSFLLVSHGQRGLDLFELGLASEGRISLGERREAGPFPPLRAVVKVAGGRGGQGRWLLVGTRGEMATLDGLVRGKPRVHPEFWEESERPAFIADYALRLERPCVDDSPAKQLLLATDLGIFEVDFSSRGASPWKRSCSPVHLPGLFRPCAAMTAREQESWRYLWASDIAGDVHLFRAASSVDVGRGARTVWTRVGIQHKSTRAVRALAACSGTGKKCARGDQPCELIVVQACRNNEVHLTQYREVAPSWKDPAKGGQQGEPDERTKADYLRWLTTRGSPSDVRDWVQTRAEGQEKELLERNCRGSRGRTRDPMTGVFEFASLMEYLADTAPSVFIETVTRPDVELPLKILKALVRSKGERGALPLAAAITFLTQAMLGAIHRNIKASGRQIECCLGLFRWLLELQRRLGNDDPELFADALDDLQKWGLLGSTYRDRTSATMPLVALSRHNPSDVGGPPAWLLARERDRAVYEAQLVLKHFDLDAFPSDELAAGGEPVAPTDPTSPGAARACAVLPLEKLVTGGVTGEALVAVAWNAPRLDLFRLRSGLAGHPTRNVLDRIGEPLLLERLGKEKVRRSPGGSGVRSRVVGLIPLRDGLFDMVISPTPPRDLTDAEVLRGREPASDAREILCYRYRAWRKRGALKIRPLVLAPQRVSLSDPFTRDSVYSLLDLGGDGDGNRVLMLGLRGSRGRSGAALLRYDGDLCPRLQALSFTVDSQDGTEPEAEPEQDQDRYWLPAPYPQASPGVRNPVLSIAVDPRDTEEAGYKRRRDVFIGCSDGQIWRLECEFGPLNDAAGEPLPARAMALVVSKLSAPVWSLARRRGRQGDDSSVDRLYAGTADGTLAAWQCVEAQGPTRKRAGFVPLWATQERSAVSMISTYQAMDAEASQGVAALTVEGMALLICDDASPRELKRFRINQLLVPGARLGRLRLPVPAMEGEVVRCTIGGQPEEDDPQICREHVRLLVAGGYGEVRTYTLHLPTSKAFNPEARREVVRAWPWGHDERERYSNQAPPIRGLGSRVPEMLSGAVEDAHLLQVEALLSPDSPGDRLPAHPLHVPLLLHDLLCFRRLWERAREVNWVAKELLPDVSDHPEQGEPVAPEILTDSLTRLLRNALRRARQLKDHRLCGTIIKHTADMLNHALLDIVSAIGVRNPSREDGEQVKGQVRPVAGFRCVSGFKCLYLAIVETLEEEGRTWGGLEGEVEEKIKIVTVKRLLDGDVYHEATLAIHADVDRPLLCTRGVLANGTVCTLGPTKRSQEKEGECFWCVHISDALLQMLWRRAKLVRSHLDTGRDTTVLETLRAVNLSLQRAAVLFTAHDRDPGASPRSASGRGVPWASIRPLFASLGEYLGRRARTREGLPDAIAHEVARTFALGVCVSPQSALVLACRLLEASGSDYLVDDVQQQLDMLAVLGIRVPQERELFLLATGQLTEGCEPAFSELIQRGGFSLHPNTWRRICESQADDIRKLTGASHSAAAMKLLAASFPLVDDDHPGTVPPRDWWKKVTWSSPHAPLGRLFRHGFTPGDPKLREKRDGQSTPTNDWRWSSASRTNLSVFLMALPFHGIAAWCSDLADSLQADPSKADFLGNLPLLREIVENIDPASAGGEGERQDYFLRHSRAFWAPAIDRYLALLDAFRPRLEALGSVSGGGGAEARSEDPRIAGSDLQTDAPDVIPLVVLLSDVVADWCFETLAALKKAKNNYSIFAPHYTLYDHALRKLRDATRGLRTSAAVQRCLVERVLGHGLLGRLDEHALEFREIAHALNPLAARHLRGTGPTAEEVHPQGCFAKYVDERALHLENIPSTLRSLQGMLETRQEALSDKADGTTLLEAVSRVIPELDREESAFSMNNDDGSRGEGTGLAEHEAAHLCLAFHEIVRNHRAHGRWQGPSQGQAQAQKIHIHLEKGGRRIRFRHVGVQPGDIQRLHTKRGSLIQRQIEAHEGKGRVSHGSGLYLAGLSAAMVGWDLQLTVESQRASEFELVFERLPGREEAKG